MLLPNHTSAWVPQEKITGYLLDVDHEDGGPKARFFREFGFEAAGWEVLAEAFLRLASRFSVSDHKSTRFGEKYVVDGYLETPDGNSPRVRTIWIIETDEDKPRLVTAYPIDE